MANVLFVKCIATLPDFPTPKDKYDSITPDNVMDILKEEVGIVFTHVLEDAGVYKCNEEGRKAFLKFIHTL